MLTRLNFGLPMAAPPDVGAFMEALRQVSGLDIAPVWLPSHDALHDAFLRGAVDLAWCPPIVAVHVETAGVGKPIVAIGRRGSVAYYGAIVSLKTSDIRRTKDLPGKRIAWVSPTSAAGYLVPRLYLLSKGLDPRSMFREEHFAGSHSGTLAMLLDGRVDVAAVFASAQSKDAFKVPGPVEKLRIVSTVGPIPNDVIVAQSRLDTGMRTVLSRAFLSLDAAALAPISLETGITRFEPLPIGHLDPLRRLAALTISGPAAPRRA